MELSSASHEHQQPQPQPQPQPQFQSQASASMSELGMEGLIPRLPSAPSNGTSSFPSSASSSSSSFQDKLQHAVEVWQDSVWPFLYNTVWKHCILEYLRHDDDDDQSPFNNANLDGIGSSGGGGSNTTIQRGKKLIAKCIVTICSYVLFYTSVSSYFAFAILYLFDHSWYLLAWTMTIGLLAVSALLLTTYQFMWKWQSSVLLLFNSNRHHNSLNGSRSNSQADLEATLTLQQQEDDFDLDLEHWKDWLKYLARQLGILFVWMIYVLIVVKIDFWIWNQYNISHPTYHATFWELRLVNGLQALPFLPGSAICLYYLLPRYYNDGRTYLWRNAQRHQFGSGAGGSLMGPGADSSSGMHDGHDMPFEPLLLTEANHHQP